MTEVQKYQGKFIERQRELKNQQKQQEKQAKEEKKEEEASEKKSMRRFLEDDGTFKGWAKTAKKLLKEVRTLKS